jgi:uncharacterized protein (TIGR03435 family)
VTPGSPDSGRILLSGLEAQSSRILVDMKRSCWASGVFGAFAAVLLAFVVAEPLLTQAQETDAAKTLPSFEVATIRPVNPHNITVIDLRVYPGGHLVIHAHRLAMMIAEAFNIPESEILGGDESVVQAWFDMEAKPPEELRDAMPGSEYSEQGIQDARVRSMLQSLLMERFHLKFHMEGQPGTVYELKRGNGPLRLRPVELKPFPLAGDATGALKPSDMNGIFKITEDSPVEIQQMSITQLAQWLAKIQKAPVIDETRLPGFYNFKSHTVATLEDFKNGNAMSLLVDVVPEMGLKLVKAQGMVEKFVIDSAEQPTAN